MPKPWPWFRAAREYGDCYSDSPWRGQPRRIHLKVGAAASRQDCISPARIIGGLLFGRSMPPMSSRLDLRLKKSILPGLGVSFHALDEGGRYSRPRFAWRKHYRARSRRQQTNADKPIVRFVVKAGLQ